MSGCYQSFVVAFELSVILYDRLGRNNLMECLFLPLSISLDKLEHLSNWNNIRPAILLQSINSDVMQFNISQREKEEFIDQRGNKNTITSFKLDWILSILVLIISKYGRKHLKQNAELEIRFTYNALGARFKVVNDFFRPQG